MRAEELPWGMQPDGTPWPVPAQVLQDPGRGALWGLVAGDVLGGAGGASEQACAVAESLMARGRYRADDVAGRLGGALVRGAPSLVRAVPIALFHAGDAARRVEVVVEAWTANGDDVATTLAAAALAGVIACAAWRHDAGPLELMVAAVEDLEAAVDRLSSSIAAAAVAAAAEVVRAELGLAVEDSVARPAEPATAAEIVRIALWHLHQGTPIDRALALPGLGSPAAAVVGAVLGAAAGEDALPAAIIDAARTLGAPMIDRLCAFVDSGPFAHG